MGDSFLKKGIILRHGKNRNGGEKPWTIFLMVRLIELTPPLWATAVM
jgi:hypothetical protein